MKVKWMLCQLCTVLLCPINGLDASELSEVVYVKEGKSVGIPARRFVGVKSSDARIARVQERVLKGGYELRGLKPGHTSLKLIFADGRVPEELKVVVEKIQKKEKRPAQFFNEGGIRNNEKSKASRTLKRGPMVVPGWN